MHPVLSPKGHLSFRHSSKFIHLWNKIPKRAHSCQFRGFKTWCPEILKVPGIVGTHANTSPVCHNTDFIDTNFTGLYSSFYTMKQKVIKNPTIFNIIPWVAGSMGRSSHRPSPSIIFFHNFLQNSLQKSFQFIFFNFL